MELVSSERRYRCRAYIATPRAKTAASEKTTLKTMVATKGDVPCPLADPVQLFPKTVDGVSEGEEEAMRVVDILIFLREKKRKEGREGAGGGRG